MEHDALYQFRKVPGFPLTRKMCDQHMRNRLRENSFALARVYYLGVRFCGGL